MVDSELNAAMGICVKQHRIPALLELKGQWQHVGECAALRNKCCNGVWEGWLTSQPIPLYSDIHLPLGDPTHPCNDTTAAGGTVPRFINPAQVKPPLSLLFHSSAVVVFLCHLGYRMSR